jgi:cytochrome c oxidase subunit 3
MVAVVSLFTTFSLAYLLRRHTGIWSLTAGGYVQDWPPLKLPVKLLLINTLVLLGSSATLEFARREAAERALLAPLSSIPGIALRPRIRVPWLGLSITLGFGFLCGQAFAWRALVASGLNIHAAVGVSFFYVLTGVHAIHLLGGLIALSYAAASTRLLSKPLELRRLILDVASWYWHVMAVVWICIFGLLALA